MPNQQKISRRDWFRLKSQSPSIAPQKTRPLVGEQTEDSKLQAVELPPNHDGMDLNELPPLREANLTSQDVNDLLDDIKALGSEVLLMQRSQGAKRATVDKLDTATQLSVASQALLGGKLDRIQIRYNWEGCHWIDTLSRESDSFRLIRVKHNSID